MNLDTAIVRHARFQSDKFLPAVESAAKGGRISPALTMDLVEAVQMSKSAGPAGEIGKAMVSQVLFVALCELLPKGKKK